MRDAPDDEVDPDNQDHSPVDKPIPSEQDIDHLLAEARKENERLKAIRGEKSLPPAKAGGTEVNETLRSMRQKYAASNMTCNCSFSRQNQVKLSHRLRFLGVLATDP